MHDSRGLTAQLEEQHKCVAAALQVTRNAVAL